MKGLLIALTVLGALATSIMPAAADALPGGSVPMTGGTVQPKCGVPGGNTVEAGCPMTGGPVQPRPSGPRPIEAGPIPHVTIPTTPVVWLPWVGGVRYF